MTTTIRIINFWIVKKNIQENNRKPSQKQPFSGKFLLKNKK